VGDEERGWPLSRPVREAQAGYRGLGNHVRIVETGKLDEPGAVAHSPSEIGGCVATARLATGTPAV